MGRVVGIDEVASLVSIEREAGRSIVTTNGAFDLLHDGHRFLFETCRRYGNVLVVGVNSDASVARSKGAERPHDADAVRAANVALYADLVFVFDDADPRGWLRVIRPDVHATAETYGERCVEAEVVREIGARLTLVPVMPELGSTTQILRRQDRQ